MGLPWDIVLRVIINEGQLVIPSLDQILAFLKARIHQLVSKNKVGSSKLTALINVDGRLKYDLNKIDLLLNRLWICKEKTLTQG